MKRAKQKQLKAPHNPLIAVVLFRKSGVHTKTEKALRREAKMATQLKLNQRED
ncbi:MAG: hypothetical protein ABL902_09040 [Gallionella sp.]